MMRILMLLVTAMFELLSRVECGKDNLRKLSISVGGIPYSDRSIQTFRPISNSSTYSPSKLPSIFTTPRNTEELVNQEKSEDKDEKPNETRHVLKEGSNNYDSSSTESPDLSDTSFDITHSLKLVLANAILKSNKLLYPFEIEHKNQTRCLCILNDEAGNAENDDSNFTKIPDLPPDCVWKNYTNETIAYSESEIFVLSNNTSPQNSVSNSSRISYPSNNTTFENNVKVDNIILKSPDNLLRCYYRIPVNISTPWEDKNFSSNNDRDFLSNNTAESIYWLNYTSYDSDVWDSIDFRKNKSDSNYLKFSIEGFWDLFKQMPNELLLQLNINEESTYNLCYSNNDKKELSLLSDYLKNNIDKNTSNVGQSDFNESSSDDGVINKVNMNIPDFSLFNARPYNNTFCSRPTGAELDMIGICPSNGLNSFYDTKTKSCVAVTYTDSTANCPKNYIHSKLWGSHRGGGGCHSKQKKYIPPILKCDPPFIFNEPRRTCIVEKYSPGFPGCIEGSIYYNLQTCIMAFQVMKEFSCPNGYHPTLEDSDDEESYEKVDFDNHKNDTNVELNTENDESDLNIYSYYNSEIFKKDISDVKYRIKTLNEAKSNYYDNKNPILTKIVNDNEHGIQSKYITKRLINNKRVKCKHKIREKVKYNGLGSPYCENINFVLKYEYNNSWMFENGPKPYCEYEDVKYVEYKCPKGTVSYDVYISSGNDPPLVIRDEFQNPFDTCVEVKIVPLQPKCHGKEEIPFIYIREPISNYEKKGIHIVSKEDIDNLDKNMLFDPSAVIDNSVPDVFNTDYSNPNENIADSIGNDNSVSEFIKLNQDEYIINTDKNRRLVDDNYLSHEHSANNELKLKLRKKPIRLYDAIVGNSEYVIKIICSDIIEAKPYLSCPENSVLVSSNMCRLKGYTDFNIMCPDGYKLDEEALILMPQEYYHKNPPRCISKQLVFTHYYCPPIFPDNVYRPFIINNTFFNFQNTKVYSDDTDHEGNSNLTKTSNITNIRVLSEESFGRAIVPSYFQKMCHEVDLIRPIWKMPNLLRILLLNLRELIKTH